MPAFVNTPHLQLHALQMKAEAEHKGTSLFSPLLLSSLLSLRVSGPGQLPRLSPAAESGPGSPGAGQPRVVLRSHGTFRKTESWKRMGG